MRGKGRCGVFAGKMCDPHLSALEVSVSQRGAIQIYVYLTFTFTEYIVDICLHYCLVNQRLTFFALGSYRATLRKFLQL